MLSDTAIRNAKPNSDKTYKLTDEKGLYLLITPSGGKWWRYDYRFDGKRKTLSMGVYPDVSLKDARDKRDDARKLLAQGIDPGDNRKAIKVARSGLLANSFETIAREWHTKMADDWTDGYKKDVMTRLERHVFPQLGHLAIDAVTAPLEAARQSETAHRALRNCSQVFRYAVATGRCERDPTADLRGALKPVRQKHHASIIDPAAEFPVSQFHLTSPRSTVFRLDVV